MHLIFALAAASVLAGCATYDDYGSGRYRYEGSAWAERRGGGGLTGPGVDILDPWLAETPEGRQIVRTGWPGARGGRIDERTAERANVWFRRHADVDRDLCLTDLEIRSALAQGAWHLAHRRLR
ncbi:MAG TPA: hypothetical protein VD887_12105 [Allosphingosinicella sp.]|nr:hypothetical protein [Allosphingosinicella sp.]HYG30944.1 hypothetical protein [Allosphingosinicella sp.]